MKVPSFSNCCIICLREHLSARNEKLTNEHVIPSSLGGTLQCKMICSDCNSTFGHSFEANAKSDPASRIAIASLRDKLPQLYEAIENGQRHKLETVLGTHRAKFLDGRILGATEELSDGSLLVPHENTEKKLTSLLRSEGMSDEDISFRLSEIHNSDINIKLQVSENLTIIQRAAYHTGADLDGGTPLNPLVCLKISYEFLVLLFGRAMLVDEQPLNSIRSALRESIFPDQHAQIEVLHAGEYRAFHGLLFENSLPHVVVQVRLFGRLAYRVHFLKLRINSPPIRYTQDLEYNSERLDRLSENE